MPTVDVTTYSDPACPFAYSAEPIRWRLRWRYGDQLRWSLRLVGLSADGESYRNAEYTPEKAAEGLRHFDHYGQPLFQGASRPVGATWPACRAIVAAREQRGVETAIRMLRQLHVLTLAQGQELSAEATIAEAAEAIGIDPGELRTWTSDPETERAFRLDLHDARHPIPAALALDHKLGDSGTDWQPDPGQDAGPGRRYTCPSYLVARDGLELTAPGMHTALTIETQVANIAPELKQRPWATDPLEVLRWAGEPLSTQEVAGVLDLEGDREEARRLLMEAGAVEQPVGSDAYWTAP